FMVRNSGDSVAAGTHRQILARLSPMPISGGQSSPLQRPNEAGSIMPKRLIGTRQARCEIEANGRVDGLRRNAGIPPSTGRGSERLMAGFGAAARRHVAKPIVRFYKCQLYRFRRALLDWQIPYRPESRRWGSGLPLGALQSIQAGALSYSYRG